MTEVITMALNAHSQHYNRNYGGYATRFFPSMHSGTENLSQVHWDVVISSV